MKKLKSRILGVCLAAAVPAAIQAADVVNGWSPVGTISKVHSVYSYT